MKPGPSLVGFWWIETRYLSPNLLKAQRKWERKWKKHAARPFLSTCDNSSTPSRRPNMFPPSLITSCYGWDLFSCPLANKLAVFVSGDFSAAECCRCASGTALSGTGSEWAGRDGWEPWKVTWLPVTRSDWTDSLTITNIRKISSSFLPSFNK